MAQDRLTAIAEFAECLDRSPDLESRLGQAHHDRKRATGVFLAVATVAHTDEFRCRIRCIANRATKAAAIQLGHLLLPPISAAISHERLYGSSTTLRNGIASRRPERSYKSSNFPRSAALPKRSLSA